VTSTDGHAATTRPYPLSLWYVDDPAWYIEDPAATEIPQTLRWSRRGWHMGKVDIGGKPAYVVIDEYEMDGVFDQRDAWALSRDSMAALKADERDLDKHAWLDGVAYRPVKIDPDGKSITFVAIKTGTTEAQEAAAKDTYLPDRNVERAAQPVVFGHDLSTALVEAGRSQSRMLLDFEAVWCGPCHTMDQLVFTAQSVVTAAGGTIAVKIDGDVHPDLKKKYNVDGYPTLILLDSHGKELRRGVGYQSVLEMLALLRQ
jgi:thiol-disulfide isomerase/thioredoxin